MVKLYKKVFDFDSTHAQFHVLPDGNPIPILGFKKVNQYYQLDNADNSFDRSYKWLKLFYTILTSSASAERSLFSIHWLKTYLRSTGMQIFLAAVDIWGNIRVFIAHSKIQRPFLGNILKLMFLLKFCLDSCFTILDG